MNEEFNIECSVCEVPTTVIVEEIDESPAFCPMCGEQLIDD